MGMFINALRLSPTAAAVRQVENYTRPENKEKYGGKKENRRSKVTKTHIRIVPLCSKASAIQMASSKEISIAISACRGGVIRMRAIAAHYPAHRT